MRTAKAAQQKPPEPPPAPGRRAERRRRRARASRLERPLEVLDARPRADQIGDDEVDGRRHEGELQSAQPQAAAARRGGGAGSGRGARLGGTAAPAPPSLTAAPARTAGRGDGGRRDARRYRARPARRAGRVSLDRGAGAGPPPGRRRRRPARAARPRRPAATRAPRRVGGHDRAAAGEPVEHLVGHHPRRLGGAPEDAEADVGGQHPRAQRGLRQRAEPGDVRETAPREVRAQLGGELTFAGEHETERLVAQQVGRLQHHVGAVQRAPLAVLEHGQRLARAARPWRLRGTRLRQRADRDDGEAPRGRPRCSW